MAKTITIVDVNIQQFGFTLAVPDTGGAAVWWCTCTYNDVGSDGLPYNNQSVRFQVPSASQNTIQNMHDWLYNQIKTREGI